MKKNHIIFFLLLFIVTQTAVRSQLVRAWTVHYAGSSFLVPVDRFYVTGVGDVYSNGYYSIGSGGGGGSSKGTHPIENASEMLSRLNGYYYDNHDFDGFEPDFTDNPNIAPEAVAGMMRDLNIDKSLGLSAADLETVLPEAIRHDPEGMVYINECSIDSRFSKASVAVYDLNGTQIKEYPVYHQGRNTVTVEANEFKPGIYMYSLLVDGKLIDTKRMVVTSK